MGSQEQPEEIINAIMLGPIFGGATAAFVRRNWGKSEQGCYPDFFIFSDADKINGRLKSVIQLKMVLLSLMKIS